MCECVDLLVCTNSEAPDFRFPAPKARFEGDLNTSIRGLRCVCTAVLTQKAETCCRQSREGEGGTRRRNPCANTWDVSHRCATSAVLFNRTSLVRVLLRLEGGSLSTCHLKAPRRYILRNTIGNYCGFYVTTSMLSYKFSCKPWLITCFAPDYSPPFN